MSKQKNIESIKSWAEEDRPREKMLLKGHEVLSDAELIAIIIGSGSRKESAVSLSKRILSSVNNNLYEVGKLTLNDLMKFNGIGEAKAISIAAALEIGRRRGNTEPKEKLQILQSRDAYDVMKSHMVDLSHEEMWILLLNRASRVLKKVKMSSGGIAGTVVDLKMILKIALDHQAHSIILVHNHPSGTLKPSEEDIHITNRIQKATKVMDILLADHIIITDRGFYSFADSNML